MFSDEFCHEHVVPVWYQSYISPNYLYAIQRVSWGHTKSHNDNLRALFTKRADVLPHDLVKSRIPEIRIYTFPIAL